MGTPRIVINYPKPPQDEPKHCSTFGCGRVLKPQETLAGNKCIHCMQIKPIHANLVIKFK